MDDLQLLREYIERGSNEAFAELVNRHIGIVYSAAARQMADVHAAEDVTQAVFIALAQSARRIRRGEVLSAWLLAVTRHIAALTRRTEARRRRREREAAELTQAMNTPTEDAMWDEIAPHLDEAIARLSERNREALILRYFEGKSMEEVAARLQISPEAARQRVSRGVEQLHTVFSRKGIVLSVAGLAGLIPAHAVQAVPSGLAVATVAAATSVAVGVSAAGMLAAKGVVAIMAWTRAKIAAIAIGLALIGGTATMVAPKIMNRNAAAVAVKPKPGPLEDLVTSLEPGIGPSGMVGQSALSAPIKLADGRQLSLAAFRGRHVLLHTWNHPSSQPPGDRKGNLPVLWERFGGEEGFAMVGVAPQRAMAYATVANSLVSVPPPPLPTLTTPWPQGYGSRDDDEMERYLRAQACYVIAPDGRIALAVFDTRQAYGELDRVLSRGSIATSPLRVVTRRKSAGEASPAYQFDDIPPIAADDAAGRAIITILDGGPEKGRIAATLVDGGGAARADDPNNSFSLFHHWLYGRIKMDLGRTVDIAQINSYSWHTSARAPQVYRVFGSDGTASGFNPSPLRGVDPAKCGWKLIAFVDTRQSHVLADMGGQYAASIRSDTGSVGRYRYLLFMFFVTQTEDWFGHTHYSEIDVVERK